MQRDDELLPLDLSALGDRTVQTAYPTSDPFDLRALFFTLAFLLMILDTIAVFLLAGGLSRLGLRRPHRRHGSCSGLRCRSPGPCRH